MRLEYRRSRCDRSLSHLAGLLVETKDTVRDLADENEDSSMSPSSLPSHQQNLVMFLRLSGYIFDPVLFLFAWVLLVFQGLGGT